jgi:hypothetical protein
MQITLTTPVSSLGGTNTTYQVKAKFGWGATGLADIVLVNTTTGDTTPYAGYSLAASSPTLLSTAQAALKAQVESKAGVTAGSSSLTLEQQISPAPPGGSAVNRDCFLVTFATPISVDGKSVSTVSVETDINLVAETAIITARDIASSLSRSWSVSIASLITQILAALTTFVASALGVSTSAFTVVNTS